MSWFESLHKNFKKKKGKNLKEILFGRNYFGRKERKDGLVAELKELDVEYAEEKDWDRQKEVAEYRERKRKRLAKINSGGLADGEEELFSKRSKKFVEKLKEKRITEVDKEGRRVKKDGFINFEPYGPDDVEYAIRWLLKKDYLSKDREIQAKQLLSLQPWITYLKDGLYNIKFLQIIFSSILQFDVDWRPRAGPDQYSDFPLFETNAPAILAKVYDFYTALNGESDEVNILGELRSLTGLNEHNMRQFEKLNFKDLYLLFRDKERLSKELRANAEVVPNSGKWLKKISFLDSNGVKVSGHDKMRIAIGLAQTCEHSEDLCLKGYTKAKEYLEAGDIYLYMVTKKVVKDGEEIFFEVPEVAIHVKRNERDEEVVNENEIHGNAENQGINPEYLQIAKGFVMQKKKVVGEDGVERETGEFRFANAAELGIKFADTVMYNRVKAKIHNLGKIDPKTNKPHPDLEPNELKFLYQIYRPVEGFELGNHLSEMVESLNDLRLQKIGDKAVSFTEAETKQRVKDIAKMFSCQPENVFYRGRGQEVPLKEIHSSVKVVVGDLFRESVSVPRDMSPWDFVFNNLIGLEVVVGSIALDMAEYPKNLKEVAGITITPKDREEMESSARDGFGYIYFPNDNDSRVGKYIYE